MKTLPWAQHTRITEAGDRIWRYLTPASDYADADVLAAAAILGWPDKDVEEIAALQFLLSAELETFLADLPHLLRRLTTSTLAKEQPERARLSGPVRWGPTLVLQGTTGDRTQFVTAPTRRIFQTPENELIVSVLNSVLACGRRIDWTSTSSRSAAAVQVRKRLTDAQYWLESRMLSQVQLSPISERSLARVRSGRARIRYASVLAAFDTHRSLVENLNRDAIRESLEQRGLASQEPSVIFELLCLFNIIDALGALGWHLTPLRVFGGKLRLEGSQASGERLTLTYQSLPPRLSGGSRYVTVLKDHAFKRVPDLRPDFVIEWGPTTEQRRVLLVECKLSESKGVAHAARQALNDLLTYRRSFDTLLPTSAWAEPYGLGIAWGKHLKSNPASEVALATPDTLTAVLKPLLGERSPTSSPV